MSRERDLDLDAILAEFHGQEEKAPAKPLNDEHRPASRRELREQAERQAAQEKESVEAEKTMLFEPAAQSPAPKREEAPASAEKKPLQPEKGAVRERNTAELPRKAPTAPARKKTRKGPGKAFALMFLVVLALAAVLTGLLRWASSAEKAAAPREPEEIRMSLGENLEAILDESAASSR